MSKFDTRQNYLTLRQPYACVPEKIGARLSGGAGRHGWELKHVMERSGLQWERKALCGAKHVVHDVSIEVVQKSESLKGGDGEENPEGRVSVRTVVPECAGGYADYGEAGTGWLRLCFGK